MYARRPKTSVGDNGNVQTGDPVIDLIIAVCERAWQDALGRPTPTCGEQPERIVMDARKFLTIWMVEFDNHMVRPRGRYVGR